MTVMENTQKGNHVVNNEAKWCEVPVTRKTSTRPVYTKKLQEFVRHLLSTANKFSPQKN